MARNEAGGRVIATQRRPSRQDYGTPWHIFRGLEHDVPGRQFLLDACASAFNAKVDTFFDKRTNGLAQLWAAITFYNPEYKTQRAWLEKANEEAKRGVHSVGLLKAATSESYWHPLAFEAGTVDFYRGRIAFLAGERGVRAPDGKRIAPGRPVPGADFASAAVFIGPTFRRRHTRYRSAKTGLLIQPGAVALEQRRAA